MDPSLAVDMAVAAPHDVHHEPTAVVVAAHQKTRRDVVEAEYHSKFQLEWQKLRGPVKALLTIVGISQFDDIIELARGCTRLPDDSDPATQAVAAAAAAAAVAAAAAGNSAAAPENAPASVEPQVDFGLMVEEVESDARTDIDDYQAAVGPSRSSMRLGDKLVMRAFFRRVLDMDKQRRLDVDAAVALDRAHERAQLADAHLGRGRKRRAPVVSVEEPPSQTMLSPSGLQIVVPSPLARDPIPPEEMMTRFETVVRKFFTSEKRGEKFKIATRGWALGSHYHLEFRPSETRVAGFVPVYKCGSVCGKTVNCYMQPDGHNVNTSNLLLHFSSRRQAEFDYTRTGCQSAAKQYTELISAEGHADVPDGMHREDQRHH